MGDPRLQKYDTLGRHIVIQGFIGRGSVGEVYRAEIMETGDSVAVKAIAADLQGSKSFSDRLHAAYDTWKKLKHPHILQVYELKEDEVREERVLYLTTPYVQGHEGGRADLGAVLALTPDHRLPVEAVLAILNQVADALHELHTQHLVHRNVKPGNILIRPGTGDLTSSHVYLTDVGLVPPSTAASEGNRQTGNAVGAPTYMAPELAKGVPSADDDPRVDVYALGCVAFEMLSGRPAFPGPTGQNRGATSRRAPQLTSARPDLHRRVNGVVRRALRGTPNRRTGTPTEFVSELRAALPPYPPPWWRRAVNAIREGWRKLGRSGRWAISVAATLTVAAAVLGAIVLPLPPDPLPPDPPPRELVGGITLAHPKAWERQSVPDAGVAAAFSPIPLNGLPTAATPEGWNQIIDALSSDPSDVVGVYVREHVEPAFLSPALADLVNAVSGDLTGSRTSLHAPPIADLLVAGRPTKVLDGDIRPWDSTDSIRISSYVISLDNATHHSVHVVFFAAPTTFDKAQDDFTKVLNSIQLDG